MVLRPYETMTDDGELLQFGMTTTERLDYMREQATLRGVWVVEVVKGKRYRTVSQTSPWLKYTIDREAGDNQWRCECKGWRHTASCKHIGAVANRADVEGWTFGQVARDMPEGYWDEQQYP